MPAGGGSMPITLVLHSRRTENKRWVKVMNPQISPPARYYKVPRVSLIKDQVLKYMSLWVTFSFNSWMIVIWKPHNSLCQPSMVREKNQTFMFQWLWGRPDWARRGNEVLHSVQQLMWIWTIFHPWKTSNCSHRVKQESKWRFSYKCAFIFNLFQFVPWRTDV